MGQAAVSLEFRVKQAVAHGRLCGDNCSRRAAADAGHLRRDMRLICDEKSDSHVAHVRVYHVAHVRITHVAHVRVYHVGHVSIYHVGHVRVSCPAVLLLNESGFLR